MAYAVIEVEKSYDLSSGSWRARNASDIKSSPSLKTQEPAEGADGASPSPKTGED